MPTDFAPIKAPGIGRDVSEHQHIRPLAEVSTTWQAVVVRLIRGSVIQWIPRSLSCSSPIGLCSSAFNPLADQELRDVDTDWRGRV